MFCCHVDQYKILFVHSHRGSATRHPILMALGMHSAVVTEAGNIHRAMLLHMLILSAERVYLFFAVMNTTQITKQKHMAGIFQQTQNICITFIQCRLNLFDVGPTLYKCYTNVLFAGMQQSPYLIILLCVRYISCGCKQENSDFHGLIIQ